MTNMMILELCIHSCVLPLIAFGTQGDVKRTWAAARVEARKAIVTPSAVSPMLHHCFAERLLEYDMPITIPRASVVRGQLQPFSSLAACCVQISLGWHHMLALDSAGAVWAWGSNRYGQCGCRPPHEAAPSAASGRPLSLQRQAQSSSSGPATKHLTAFSEAAVRHAEQAPAGSSEEPHLHTGAPSQHVRRTDRGKSQQPLWTKTSQSAEHRDVLPSSAQLGTVWESRIGAARNHKHDESPAAPMYMYGRDDIDQMPDEEVSESTCSQPRNDELLLRSGRQQPEADLSSAENCGSIIQAEPRHQQQAQEAQGRYSDHDVGQKSCATPDHGLSAQPCLSQGQLETSIRQLSHLKPVQGLISSPCLAIAAGSEHSLAVGRDGGVFAWGWGEHGQLGVGDQNDVCCVVRVKGLPPMRGCAAGCGFSFVF